MREIKFRGKRLDNDEWVYGYYGYKEASDQHFIMIETMNLHHDWTYFTDYEVDPETVGQYTGLKDKNGKELYEGDIVRFTHVLHKKKAIKAKVVFHPVILAFVFMVENDLGYFANNAELRNLEIIGNIYEPLNC